MPGTSVNPIPIKLLAVAAALWLTLGSALAASFNLPHTEIHNVLLPNGLRALMVEDHQAPVVHVQVWYAVGSKNESAGNTGFAHLFEHLMYEGTKNLSPGQFSDYLVRAGGITNAYTDEDTTVYWETVPSTYLPVVLWLEADRMRNLEITGAELDTEREVVKEERRVRFDNQPYGGVVETLYAQAFTVHPYRHPTIGSMEDLDRATVADIRNFYDTYYVPNNATVVIVGDFESREAEYLVKEYFGFLAAGQRLPGPPIPQEPPQAARREVKTVLEVPLPVFVEGYHLPADGTPDAYPLRLAEKILSDGQSSRIYRRLVYDQQIALDARSTGHFAQDPNLMFVLAAMNPGHAPAEGRVELEAELERLKNELVSSAELTRAKNQILRDFLLARQNLQTRAEELGYAAVVLRDPQLVNTELDRFLAVAAADIQRVARKYFVPENVTIVEVYPRTGAPAMESPPK